MSRIHVLPPQLASQIAAGEVVERPASALKELIENALDAGARRCDIALEGGGITRLSIQDDGTGMTREDARLAVERHATSKLNTFDDLNRVRSYGFRGEALPSIASVSRFVLETRAEGEDVGTSLLLEDGAVKVQDVGMGVGTKVTVRDLFYNVPARRKFLRSSATEAGHVVDVVENAALACPDVTFTLERDGRRSREWLRVPSRGERVAMSFPQEEFTECRGERGPLLFEAYLGRPERSRNGAAGLKLFCNSRPVRDRAVLATIAQAFGSVLERGRYPRGVVYLDLPPELVDVNVHPQKSEVRFADGRAVTDAVYQIASAHLAKAFSLPKSGAPSPRQVPLQRGIEASRPSTWFLPSKGLVGTDAPPLSAERAESTAPVNEGEHAPDVRAVVDTPADWKSRLNVRDAVQPSLRLDSSRSQGTVTRNENVSVEQRDPETEAPRNALHPTPAAPATSRRTEGGVEWSRLRFIAQVRATYLLCEGDDALYVLDQHAAAERVTFHRLREQYHKESLTSQSLLFPLTVEVTAEQSELLESKQSEVHKLGFEVRVHSETTVSLHAVPRLLQRGSPERLLFDLLSELSRSGRAFSDAVDLVLSTMACHGSIRSGDSISKQEASALLQALDQVDFSGHCPHGRPIVASTSWAELERRVGRR